MNYGACAAEHNWRMQQLWRVPGHSRARLKENEELLRSQEVFFYSNLPFLLFSSNVKNLKSVLSPIITCQAPLKYLTCL